MRTGCRKSERDVIEEHLWTSEGEEDETHDMKKISTIANSRTFPKKEKKKMLRGLFEGRNEGAIGSGGLWGLWGRSHSEAAAWCDGLRPVKAPGSVLRSCEEWWTAKVHQDFVLPHTCWPRACIHDKGTLLMRNDLMWTPQGGKKECFSFWFGFSSPRVLVHTESSPWAQSGFA